MIRTACAWVLVVLAASPVTAPFSTCELSDLFTPWSVTHVAFAPTAIASTPLTVDDDANTVSPVLTRRESAAESRAGHAMLTFHALSVVLRGVGRQSQASRTPHDRPTQPTVLRL